MPRRGRAERIIVARDRRGRFVPIGTRFPKSRPITTRGAAGLPVRRDPRTGQFLGKRAPTPTPRHPRTGRFITKAEDAALRRRPERDLVRGFIRQSPKLRAFFGALTDAQQDWFEGRMLHWQRVGFEPRMAANISVQEFERGEEFETGEQVPEE